jgi:hypothetical protein
MRTDATIPPLGIARLPTPPLSSPFSALHPEPRAGASVFARLLREIDQGASLVRDAMDVAHAFGTRRAGATDVVGAELIALQVGVYRYGEALDLAARLVDRATGSIKTVLQGQ